MFSLSADCTKYLLSLDLNPSCNRFLLVLIGSYLHPTSLRSLQSGHSRLWTPVVSCYFVLQKKEPPKLAVALSTSCSRLSSDHPSCMPMISATLGTASTDAFASRNASLVRRSKKSSGLSQYSCCKFSMKTASIPIISSVVKYNHALVEHPSPYNIHQPG